MDVYSRSGFYIYPNYCYKLEFSDNVVTLGRITNINNNIISITNAYNEEVAKKMNIIYDTLYYNFSEIKSIILISGDLYNPENRTIMLINYNLEITKLACSSLPYKICLQSGKILDCFPFLTNNSIALIYEENGELKILDSKY